MSADFEKANKMENFGWHSVFDRMSGITRSSLLFFGSNCAVEGLGHEILAYVLSLDKKRTGHSVNCRIISNIVHEELDALGLANLLTFQPNNTVIYFHDKRGEITHVGYIDGYNGRFRSRGSIDTVHLSDGKWKTFISLDDPSVGSLELTSTFSRNSRLAKMYMGEVWVCSIVEAIRSRDGSISMFSLSYHQGNIPSRVAVKLIRKSRCPTHSQTQSIASNYIDHPNMHSHPASYEPLREIEIYNYIRSCHGPTSSTGSSGILSPIDILETNCLYGIVMPYYRGGDLFEYVLGYQGEWTEAICKSLFLRVLHGVKSLHNLDICHRDLSAENVLLDIDDSNTVRDCVIGDFGQAVVANSHEDDDDAAKSSSSNSRPFDSHNNSNNNSADRIRRHLLPNERTYKKLYRPPELADADLVARTPLVDFYKCDIYALGIILYFLLTRDMPFNAENWNDQGDWYAILQEGDIAENEVRVSNVDKTTNLIRTSYHELQSVVSEGALDLLSQMLVYDPNYRSITLDEVLKHPWLACVDNTWESNVSGHSSSTVPSNPATTPIVSTPQQSLITQLNSLSIAGVSPTTASSYSSPL